MTQYQALFEYDESVNDAITVIMDYLREQPGQQRVTRAQALRFAVITAAMNIQTERMKAGEAG